jgi:hypothetical protein
MKRTYRIEVEFEATFDRKISSRSWARRIQEQCAKIAPEGWSVTRTRVRSRAVPKPAAMPPPDSQDAVREEVLAQLQGIATDASRFIQAAPNPRVKQWPNRWCGPKLGNGFSSRTSAHAHITPGNFWFRNKKLGKLRGIICIPRKTLDRVATGTENPVDLMIHEVAHLRFRTGHDHRGRRYEEAIERLERDYYLNVLGVKEN